MVAAATRPRSIWSVETGRDEVYVRPFPNTGGAKWLVSTAGGLEPLWSRSGRELFYRNGRREMVTVEVETGSTFAVGPSRVLFSAAPFESSLFRAQYDVALDDRRFIMVHRRRGDNQGALILVLNWLEEVKRLVPK